MITFIEIETFDKNIYFCNKQSLITDSGKNLKDVNHSLSVSSFLYSFNGFFTLKVAWINKNDTFYINIFNIIINEGNAGIQAA